MPETKDVQDADRYDVEISYKVTKVGAERPMSTDQLAFNDQTYDAVIAVNAAMLEMLNCLFGFGIDTAVAKGFAKNLEALGIEKRGKKPN